MGSFIIDFLKLYFQWSFLLMSLWFVREFVNGTLKESIGYGRITQEKFIKRLFINILIIPCVAVKTLWEKL